MQQQHPCWKPICRQLKLPTFAQNYAAFASKMPHAPASPASAICWPSARQKSPSAMPIGWNAPSPRPNFRCSKNSRSSTGVACKGSPRQRVRAGARRLHHSG